MGVALRAVTDFLIGDIASPHTSISMEEAPIGSQTVFVSQRGTLGGVLIGSPGHLQTTVVSQVLAEGQATVGL